MRVQTTVRPPAGTDADTIVVGAFGGETPQEPALAALVASGEARLTAGTVALAHDGGRRLLLAGLGPRERFTAETARVAAAKAARRGAELHARSLCWELPSGTGEDVAAALVEGTVLAAYRFDRYRTAPEDPANGDRLDELTISAAAGVEAAVARAHTIADAVNVARALQDTPSNDLRPGDLAAHAQTLSELPGVSVEVERREGIVARGMGAFAAVARGSDEEPALITVRYEAPGASGPVLGFVGKAVTFDSGGISIKPSLNMEEMKYDMSGGAAVLGAVEAIARLALPVRVVAVVGATENLPGGHAAKPGDIVRTLDGLTVEINNTDAEGRLVLADCITHAIALGAERLVDLATLTGAVVVALGKTYAGLLSNDDAWCERVAAAGERTGELLWRLPLHREYAEAVKGTFADLNNAPGGRRAGAIMGAEFLHRFAGDVPWAHLDIAGTAWDLGRAYAEKGGAGFGVRLLVELASSA
jgi:leucyl aminopeptidase